MRYPASTVNFDLSSDQELLVTTVRRFVSERVARDAGSFDERREAPRALFAALGELGLLGFDELGALEWALVLEQLGQGSGGLALAVLAHATASRWLNDDARRVWGARLGTGEKLATTDALLTTLATATRSGPAPLANHADLWVVLRPHGAFAIAPGDIAGTELLGGRAAGFGTSAVDTSGLPKSSQLVVDPSVLERELALGTAAIALGVGEAALGAARRYALERKQFGQPIADFQAIQWKLADSATGLAAARLAVHAAATGSGSAAAAKLLASAAAVAASDDAIQVHGGVGFTREFPVERCYRDSQLLALVGGTGDAQKRSIAARLLGGA